MREEFTILTIITNHSKDTDNMYSLVSSSFPNIKYNYWGNFLKIEGLDGGLPQNTEDQLYKLILKEGTIDGKLLECWKASSEEEDFFIHIFDSKKKLLAEYELGYIHDINSIESPVVSTIEVICSIEPSKIGIEAIWDMRVNHKINKKGIWKTLPKKYRRAWLEAAMHNRVKKGDQKNLILSIDGSTMDDIDAFYCTIGEEINGAGGYFGWNLNALIDCLKGGFGAKLPLTLHWQNHKTSEKNLKEDFVEIIEILIEANVKLKLA